MIHDQPANVSTASSRQYYAPMNHPRLL